MVSQGHSQSQFQEARMKFSPGQAVCSNQRSKVGQDTRNRCKMQDRGRRHLRLIRTQSNAAQDTLRPHASNSMPTKIESSSMRAEVLVRARVLEDEPRSANPSTEDTILEGAHDAPSICAASCI